MNLSSNFFWRCWGNNSTIYVLSSLIFLLFFFFFCLHFLFSFGKVSWGKGWMTNHIFPLSMESVKGQNRFHLFYSFSKPFDFQKMVTWSGINFFKMFLIWLQFCALIQYILFIDKRKCIYTCIFNLVYLSLFFIFFINYKPFL